MAIEDGHFWVVDVEGNGASPPEIVELAAVEVRDFALTNRYRSWLIKPSSSIQPMASRIHGLKDADVAASPTIDHIAPDFLELIGDLPIAGHHVRVEVDTLTRSIAGFRPKVAIDTLRLAKALLHERSSYGLESLAKEIPDIEVARNRGTRGPHSALYDATCSALLLLHLIHAVPKARRTSVLHDADLFDQRQASLL